MRGHRGAVRASRLTASVFGVLSGIGGLTHGVGEVLQGNIPAPGPWISSWTQGPIAERMGGEPGFTVLPTLLMAGVSTLAVSAAIIVWAVSQLHRRHSGRVLMALAVLLLAVGGGVGPPLIGLFAGLALPSAKAIAEGAVTAPGVVKRGVARLWPWLFAITSLNGAFLVVGSVVLVGLLGLGSADVFLTSFYLLIPTLLLTVLAARAREDPRWG